MRPLRLLVGLVTLALPLVAGCASDKEDGASGAGTQDVTAAKPKAGAKVPARFRQLKQGPTEKTLAGLSAAGAKIDNSLLGTEKFLKPTNEGSDAGAREKRIKEVMHKFMCSFFDEAIVISHRSGAAAAKKAVEDLDLSSSMENSDSPEAKALVDAIGAAATDSDLDVMSGQASGNNTFGTVLGVYDKKNNEVMFFGFTNCGSDD